MASYAKSNFAPLPDLPVWNTDWLGGSFETLRDSVLSSLLKASPPQVLAIEGDWGTGKTSLLHHLFREIEGDCPHNPACLEASPGKKPAHYGQLRAVWFEAWRYQHEPSPTAALVAEIRRQLTDEERLFRFFKKGTDTKLLASLASLASEFSTVMEIAGTALGVAGSAIGEPATATIGLALRSIAHLAKARSSDQKNTGVGTMDVRDAMHAAIRRYLRELAKKAGSPSTSCRLIIMIDDLDRCHAGAALRLLEDIKIWFDLPSCLFLLGLNRREIRRGLSESLARPRTGLQPLTIDDHLADEYLEKICPHRWQIAPPATVARRKYALHCLGLPVKKGDTPHLPPPFHYGAETLLASAVTYPGDGTVHSLIALPANPRRIKAIANRLRYLIGEKQDLFLLDADPVQIWRVAWFAAVAHTCHPDLFRLLQEDPRAIATVIQWAEGQLAESSKLRPFFERLLLPGSIESVNPADAPLDRVPLFSPLFQDYSDLRLFLLQHFVAAYKTDLQALYVLGEFLAL